MLDRQRGQVECLLSNHLSRQPLWKKCLQDSSLTSSSDSNPQRHTEHSIVLLLAPPLLWFRDLNWVIDILLSLAFSWGYSPGSSSWSGAAQFAPTTWITDLTMFLSGATDKTVFITSTGSTPSAALGKLESPISTKAREILALDFARLEEEERKESVLEAIHLHTPELE